MPKFTRCQELRRLDLDGEGLRSIWLNFTHHEARDIDLVLNLLLCALTVAFIAARCGWHCHVEKTSCHTIMFDIFPAPMKSFQRIATLFKVA